jgi:hypothetical protein
MVNDRLVDFGVVYILLSTVAAFVPFDLLLLSFMRCKSSFLYEYRPAAITHTQTVRIPITRGYQEVQPCAVAVHLLVGLRRCSRGGGISSSQSSSSSSLSELF